MASKVEIRLQMAPLLASDTVPAGGATLRADQSAARRAAGALGAERRFTSGRSRRAVAEAAQDVGRESGGWMPRVLAAQTLQNSAGLVEAALGECQECLVVETPAGVLRH